MKSFVGLGRFRARVGKLLGFGALFSQIEAMSDLLIRTIHRTLNVHYRRCHLHRGLQRRRPPSPSHPASCALSGDRWRVSFGHPDPRRRARHHPNPGKWSAGLTADAYDDGSSVAIHLPPEACPTAKMDRRQRMADLIGRDGVVNVVRDVGLCGTLSKRCRLSSAKSTKKTSNRTCASPSRSSALGTELIFYSGGAIIQAGGVLIQSMPDSPDEVKTVIREAQHLLRAGELYDLLAAGPQTPESLAKLVLGPYADGWKRKTRASYSSAAAAIESGSRDAARAFSEMELDEMIAEGKAEITCNFCADVYQFSVDELTRSVAANRKSQTDAGAVALSVCRAEVAMRLPRASGGGAGVDAFVTRSAVAGQPGCGAQSGSGGTTVRRSTSDDSGVGWSHPHRAFNGAVEQVGQGQDSLRHRRRIWDRFLAAESMARRQYQRQWWQQRGPDFGDGDGGIGGVHRGDGFDISCDLTTLGSEAVAVVSAGPKRSSICQRRWNIWKRWACRWWATEPPSCQRFTLRKAGLRLLHRVDGPEPAARLIDSHFAVHPRRRCFVQSIPDAEALPSELVDRALQAALSAAETAQVGGKALTPFLLAQLQRKRGAAQRAGKLCANRRQYSRRWEVAVALSAQRKAA